MTLTSKRAEIVSIAALVLSVVFFVLTMLVGLYSKSFAVFTLGWHILGSALVWLVLVILYHQRSLAEQEKLDMAQLANQQGTDTIFDGDAHRKQLFAVAQKRLAILEKWFVPIFSAAIAVYQITVGIFLVGDIPDLDSLLLQNPGPAAFFMVMVAFVSFLMSRYATGLSSEKQWRDLRAGGSVMLATAILAFAISITLCLAWFNTMSPLYILGWVVPVVIIVLGAETILNSVMDIYRPRIAGQHARMSIDSRLLGVINEPGGILHTFASAIDYQFGFQVSQTWFYRMLEKAIIPLFLFSVVSIYLLSCIVIVQPGQQAVIEHFGSFENGGRIVEPGLTFKLPYPFDIAYTYPTRRISQVNIGFVMDEEADADKALLWGEKHYAEEYDLLVASTPDSVEATTEGDQETVPVNIIKASVPVQYKIHDLEAYVYNNSDSKAMLEAICYQELARFAASSTVSIDDDVEAVNSLLGAGRRKASEILTASIQQAVDKAGLGVEVVLVGLEGVHPPPEIAEAYQEVISAVQKKQASILNAQAERNDQLTVLAGSISQADKLYDLAIKYQQAKEDGSDAALIEKLAGEMDEAFATSEGEVFAKLSQAKSYAFEKAELAKAVGVRFKGQVTAYRASPDIYKKTQRLLMLEEALQDVRKYIVLADEDDSQIYEIDLTEKLNTGLGKMDIPGKIAD